MNGMIRVALFCLATVLPAQATGLSPWMGSNDQTPFQFDPNTMVAATFAADPLQTDSTTELPCDPKTCLTGTNAAKTSETARGTPQK